MGLLDWFKKPLNWWLGMLLIVSGTVLVRGIDGWESSVPVGAISIFVGITMVVFFGKVDKES